MTVPVRETGSPARSGYLYVVAGFSALGGVLFGYDTGVISGALLFIRQDFDLSPWWQGAVVSVLMIGAMVGAVICGPLADRFGRRRILLATALVFGIGSLAASAAPSVELLTAMRFVLGIAVGMASVAVPLYIAELAPPHSRGRLVALNQLAITVGILIAYLANYVLTDSANWRAMLGLGAVPAVVLFAGMLFLPDSPRWFITRQQNTRARQVLQRIRGTAAVDDEIADIERAESQETLGRRELFQPWIRRILVIGMVFFFFAQASGINTIIYFAPTILESTGLGASSSVLATVGIGVVNVLMTIVGMALVDRVGRRPLLIVGLAGMAVSLTVLGAAFALTDLSGAMSYVAMACLVVYVAAFAGAVGVVYFVLPSEIFPLKVRGAAMSIALVINWGTAFVVSLTFLSLIDWLGRPGTFWLYAAIGLAFLLFSFFCIPETKQQSLEGIETGMRDRAARRARGTGD